MITLVISELNSFLAVNVEHELSVDTSSGGKLDINFDIFLPSLPCAVVSVDSKDVSGEHELDITSSVYKRRIANDGSFLGSAAPEKQDVKSTAGISVLSAQGTNTYGGQAYTILLHDNETAILDELRKQLNEGCHTYGTLHVNKVAGNFHISMHAQNFHILHHLYPNMQGVNMSHVINRLSFGKVFPGQQSPLDAETKILTNKSLAHGVYEYYIKVVPTVYDYLGGVNVSTNQYSVTEHFKVTLFGFPAIVFNYELSPIMMRVSESRSSFLHFVTQLCAIVGGVFVVSGALHRLVYNSVRSVKKRLKSS